MSALISAKGRKRILACCLWCRITAKSTNASAYHASGYLHSPYPVRCQKSFVFQPLKASPETDKSEIYASVRFFPPVPFIYHPQPFAARSIRSSTYPSYCRSVTQIYAHVRRSAPSAMSQSAAFAGNLGNQAVVLARAGSAPLRC